VPVVRICLPGSIPENVFYILVIRKVLTGIWISIIAGGLISYLVWPQAFTPQNIAAFLEAFQNEALLIYLLVSIARGFTLLPSTPLVLAGTLIFPTSPWLVLIVSLLGIVISSSMIYWFSDLLGFDEYFESKKPKHVQRIRTKLEHPLGLGFVSLWAFFPLVPTDAVCYVAGTLRMHFAKFITAVFIGELVLCAFYVFGGGHLFSLLNG
jgi:uncharacterized membrane protein YdjX (TVP38/TMEM64 family)